MKLENSRYFTILSGSCSLSLLAAFADGRDILFRIIQTDELALSLFSYTNIVAKSVAEGRHESRDENALIILIEKQDFALYDLLFNRVILNAAKLGAGSYCVISDTLILLQKRGYTDILANSCRKLQFLQIRSSVLSVVSGEIDKSMPIKTFRNNLNIEFRKLKPKATNEQIPIYGNHWYSAFTYWLFLRRGTVEQWRSSDRREYDECGMHSAYYNGSAASNLFSICVVPYVYLCSHDTYAEDVERDEDNSNRDNFRLLQVLDRIDCKLYGIDKDLKKNHTRAKFCYYLIQFLIHILDHLRPLITPRDGTPIYKRKSALSQLALNQQENDIFSQKNTVLEALLHFKWVTKIKYRFFLVCLVHAVYYVSFSVGVLFANEVFNYNVGATIAGDAKDILTVFLMLTSCGILWFQEVHQFLKMGSSCLKYFSSLYNWVDLFALSLPIVNLWQMLTDKPGLDELGAITTIVLWLHMVLRLRAIAFFGVTVETIIQLMKSVYKTLIIMLLVIFAFTNAFIVLLARKDDSYFQEKYSGAMVLNNSDPSSENAVNYCDDSSSNNFKDPFKAFSTL